MDSIRITIPLKKIKQTKQTKKQLKSSVASLLQYHVEIKQNCLKYFHGCWVKVVDIKTMEYNSGGFLTKMDNDKVYLRTIQASELSEFYIDSSKFYTKQDTEQYIAMQQIEIDKEKIRIDKIHLQNKMKNLKEKEKILNDKQEMFKKQKYKFEKLRYKFLKLVQDGKAKILI